MPLPAAGDLQAQDVINTLILEGSSISQIGGDLYDTRGES